MSPRQREQTISDVDLKYEVLLLKHQLREVIEDLKEIKLSQQETTRYMYNTQGGWKSLVSMLTLAGGLGGLFTLFMTYLFPVKH